MKKAVLWAVIALVFGMMFTGCPSSANDEPPVLAGTVSITGIPQVGSMLTADIGSLEGNGTVTYHWMRGTTGIGTNSYTYILHEDDLGSYITVTVTRSGYSGSITSALVGPVVGAGDYIPGIPQPLPAPQITLTGSVISWAAVPNALYFRIYVGGEQRTNVGNLTYFDIAKLHLGIGAHVVTVVAIGFSGYVSIPSNAVTFVVGLLPAPQITLVGSVISWAAIPYANEFIISVGGMRWRYLGPAYRTFDLASLYLGAGDHIVTVVAADNTDWGRNSVPSNEVVFVVGLLPAPQITLVGSVISWSAVPDADGFIIYGGGMRWTSLEPASRAFDLASLHLGAGDHIITVVSADNTGRGRNSIPSNEVVFTVGPLPAPQITLTGSVVSWTAVPGAYGYSWFLNGLSAGTRLGADETSLDLADFLFGTNVHVVVTVIALGISGQSLNSVASNEVIFMVPGIPLTGTVSIAGDVRVGQVLTANRSGFNALADLWVSFQWERGTYPNFTPIPYATGSRHTVQTADVGYTIRVVITSRGFTGYVVGGPTIPVPAQELVINFAVDIAADIPGHTIRLRDNLEEAPTITLFNPEQFDAGSIRWLSGGSQITGWPMVSGSHGQTLTLDSRVHNNRMGTHRITVEVSKGGVLHSRVIAITVEL